MSDIREQSFRIVSGPTSERLQSIREFLSRGAASPYTTVFHIVADLDSEPDRVATTPITDTFRRHAPLSVRITELEPKPDGQSYAFTASVTTPNRIAHTDIPSYATVSGLYSPLTTTGLLRLL